MAISYIQSFNQGQISGKYDGRSDLAAYKNGCRQLDNFYVLPQGGVERRTGSEHIALTKGASAAGDQPVRLIPFDFSAQVNYIIELGPKTTSTAGYVRIYNSTLENFSSGQNYVDATFANDVEGNPTTINYSATEIFEVQFVRRFDTIILTHPNHETLKLVRTTIAPAFEISEVDYIYPPTLDMNLTAKAILASGTTGEITLESDTTTTSGVETTGVFFDGHQNSRWVMNVPRGNAERIVSVDGITADHTGSSSQELDVSFTNFSVSTTGTYRGLLIVQRNIDGAGFVDYVVLQNTTSLTAEQVEFTSTETQGKNTQVRIKFIDDDGTLNYKLTTDALYQRGIVQILKNGTNSIGIGKSVSSVSYSSPTLTVTANGHNLVNGDMVDITGVTSDSGAEVITNKEISNKTANTFDITITASLSNVDVDSDAVISGSSKVKATVLSPLASSMTSTLITGWSEAAFSDYRGHSASAEFYENRLFFTGSVSEPSTIYGSVVNDIYSFLFDARLDGTSIKRVVDSPEESKYILGKKNLFMGTDGGTISINSVDGDALITQANINTQVENSYGSSNVQPAIANDVIVYVQKNKKRIRELIYSREQDVVLGVDLNMHSEDILETGVNNIFVQKNPYQVIWCIKENGKMCALTYDRVERLQGWANIETNGTFISGISLSSTNEDLIVLCVNRGTTASPKYCLEKFRFREDLNWYVDGGVQIDHSTNQYTTVELNLFTGGGVQKFKIGKDNVSGLVENDLIKISGLTDIPILNNKVFKLVNLNSNDWILKTIDGSSEIRPPAGITDQNYSVSVKKVVNTLTGLSHLEGKTVQVIGDGSFIKEETVSSGQITTDAYYNKLLAGLKFTSTLKPMPIEPQLAESTSQSRKKVLSKLNIRFLKSKGAKVGEDGQQLTNLPVVKTSDVAGQEISLVTAERRFFIGSDYEREKLIEVSQDLPYPMTVLSIAINIQLEGS